ncbi:hypothetical protein C672_1849 [[Clostridium] bifermentans ATCC 638]|uniref:DUF2971 domain-containing protein n=1 Tax=Paraclostridium bifermentans ATCC 638 = DSM 14991 TaxID=1233171 RepID=T4VP47_PARBF|nr:DUF2971 domain-containing protein [Paraclostridium bifermentans]EQK42905.1 hypothetical protein C672_1849 [[Clostridium] bifermentans ATCC 638] [Paraclostridium bifermentans ATCC 638 = DSM 14991]UAG16789.1 DUF2971 domain-containing protein [Paraclostridium bifermentans]
MQNMWKKDYWNLLYNSYDEIAIKKSRNLRHCKFPEKLYRYRDVNDYSKEELESSRVWLSHPNDFNDPYDSFFSLNTFEHVSRNLLKSKTIFNKNYGKIISDLNIDLDTYFDEIITKDNPLEFLFYDLSEKAQINSGSEVYKILKETINELNQEKINYYRSHWCVACFSEVNDSILMWSHYSNNHEGFCIEYDFKNVDTPIYMDLIRPVIYDDKIVESYINKKPSLIIGALTKKSKCWSYENEWRLVIEHDIVKNNRKYIVPKAKSIYLGCKISAKNKDLLISIAKDRNISVYQMKMCSDEFKLISNKIL